MSEWKTPMKFMAATALLVAMTAPAAAQTLPVPSVRPSTPRADDSDSEPYRRWHLGVTMGAERVDRTGITGGGELGIRIRKGLHAVVEAGWMSDVVTRRRIDEINGYINYVRTAYPTTPFDGKIDGTALFGLVGVRLIPDGRRPGQGAGVRPYVMASAGIARVEYQPEFVVDGRAISGPGIGVFGVTLGRDLLGTTNRFAYSGGAGLVVGDAWYLDLGARVTRMQTTDHPTTVTRLIVGIGRRF